MPNLVIVTSTKSVGCTFLDWSILFLSGQEYHYSCDVKQSVPVPNDPLCQTNNISNAHKHIKNHSSGLMSTSNKIAELLTNGAALETLYPTMLHLDRAISAAGFDLKDFCFDDKNLGIIKEIIKNDYASIIDHCIKQGLPTIIVKSDPTPRGYYWNTRSLDRKLLAEEPAESIDDLSAEFQDTYFNQSQRAWKDLGLTNVWDQRERMALDLRPFDRDDFISFGTKDPHLHINCQDLWNLAPEVLRDCFDYLQLKINQDRWHQWSQVARRWQDMQHRNLRFYHSLDHIVDSIINNWYFPLPNLELWQEATIQHCLIYQHDLNLKTWQLTKFPDNTQKLHCLLEPNIHKVPKIY